MSKVLVAAVLAFAAISCYAQPRPDYGPSINLETAKKVMAAAQAESRKNGWNMAIAVVDTAGNLVAYEKMDQTQTASVQVAIDKAVSAAIYRRSTKVFEDIVAKGGAGLRVMNLRNASMVEGGLPIFADGKVIGAIGVSGANADQDGVAAKAGADLVK
jgi:glc operon protein GlcG